MWNRRRSKLALRTGIVIGSASLALSSVLAYFLFARTYQVEVDAANDRLRQLAATVSSSAAIAAYLDDTELAQEIGRGLLANDIVAGLTLTSTSSLRVAMGAEVKDDDPHKLVLPVQSPFFDEQIGAITILPDQDLIESTARDDAIVSAATMAMLSAVLVAMVILLVQYQLTKPLRSLAHAVHGITPGSDERLEPIAGHSSDEIGLLVDDVNHLLDSVRNALDSERDLRGDIESLALRFRLIFENASSGIVLSDLQGNIKLFNPSFEDMVIKARTLDEVHQRTVRLMDLFADPQQVAKAMADAVHHPGVSLDLRLRNFEGIANGWLHGLFSPVRGESEELLIETILYDITERADRERQTRLEAEHDPLTGLMNRRACERHIEGLLEEAKKRSQPIAVALIDLDRFKPVNDKYGHEAGDHVLKVVAGRLTNDIRSRDFVVRWGGDEFVVILVESGGWRDTHSTADRLLTCLRAPIEVEKGVEVQVGASIGIALYPEHGSTFSELLTSADEAMYRAKSGGRNAYVMSR